MKLPEENKGEICKSIEPVTEEHVIPKHRFDEVNAKYRALKNDYLTLEEENKKQEEQIKSLCKQIEEIKSKAEKESLSLTLREIFVEGGFKREEYENIVHRISCPTKEETILLAKEIVNMVSGKQSTS